MPRSPTLVHDRSGGNPFFAQELVELLVGEGHLGRRGVDAPRVPAAVADVVRRRVGRLPAADAAAALGRVGGRPHVRPRRRARGRRTSRWATCSPRSTRRSTSGSCVDDPDAIARFRFSHALVAEALESELAPSRRARLHASTALALERLRAGTVESYLAEMAHHALGGAMAGTARQAVDWSVRAAELADASLAPEDAAGHYERALLACELAHPGDVRVRYDLTLALAEAAGPRRQRDRVARGVRRRDRARASNSTTSRRWWRPPRA